MFLLFVLSINLFSIIATAYYIYSLKYRSLDLQKNEEHNKCTFFIILSFLSLWITNGTIHDLK